MQVIQRQSFGAVHAKDGSGEGSVGGPTVSLNVGMRYEDPHRRLHFVPPTGVCLSRRYRRAAVSARSSHDGL